MSGTSLAIPTRIATPRCFYLAPVINKSQAYTQAGEHKSKVFRFDPRQLMRAFSKSRQAGIEVELLERRLVPFWHIRCRSHFDYTRMQDYTISAFDPQAVNITIQGNDTHGAPMEMVYRVDQTGRSGRQVKLTGIERCITDRDVTQWIDSYMPTADWLPKDVEEHQARLMDTAKQKPSPVLDIVKFGQDLIVDDTPLFDDDVKTIVVPPLETADNVVRRTLQQVMVPIEAATIYEWGLEVINTDLYFRPLYVFQFERLDQDGNAIERKLEELDALYKDKWINLQATEYQMSTIPWLKIMKLSTDIGAIILRDAPIIGTGLKIASAVMDQTPGILNNMNR